MDFFGPPSWEHLLGRVRIDPDDYAGGFIWSVTEDLQHPGDEEQRILISSPLPPVDQEEEEVIDVVGLDVEDVLERGGFFRPVTEDLQRRSDEEHRIFNSPQLLPVDQETEEEIDGVGLDKKKVLERDVFFCPVNEDLHHPNDEEHRTLIGPPLPSEDHKEEEEIHVVGLDEEGGFFWPVTEDLQHPSDVPERNGEEQNPDEDSHDLPVIASVANDEEEQVVPSTSGIRKSARRSIEDSDEEEAAAKRPKWSDASDSD